jgi:hypothetical protein
MPNSSWFGHGASSITRANIGVPAYIKVCRRNAGSLRF